MKIIGLTGGIGTGKSTVSNYLIEKGFKIADADKIAREIVMPGMPALEEIRNVFGESVINEDGSLNRKALGAIVFKDENKRKTLESITMSKICEVIEERTNEYRNTEKHIAFIDAPLLFEAGLDRLTDEIWVVDADIEVRLERVMKRDNISREAVMDRINSQFAKDFLLSKADVILDNSGTLEELIAQIDKLLGEYE